MQHKEDGTLCEYCQKIQAKHDYVCMTNCRLLFLIKQEKESDKNNVCSKAFIPECRTK